MAMPKHRIDGVLGNGWYDEWRQMEKDTELEKRRAKTNKTRFSKFTGAGTTDRLWCDLRLLESVSSDYGKAINRIARRQPFNTKKVRQIHDVFTLALGAVKHDNDALDAAFAIGIVTGFVAFPFTVLQLRAKRLAENLNSLIEHLGQAILETNEASGQAAINAIVTIITLFIPPLGLLSRCGIFVGQWLLDDALGPSTSNAASVGNKASITVSQFGDAVSKVEKLGTKTRTISKVAGKVATATGFVFDANEVLIGYGNVRKIQQMIAQAKRCYSDLNAEIQRHKPTLTKFQRDYQRWQVSIKSIKQNAAAIRNALQAEIKQTGYKLS